MLILFPLKLGFLNMLSVKTLRARYRQPVSISLINVDRMRDPRFPELCLDGVMQYYLPFNMETLISQVKRRVSGDEIVHYDITKTVSVYPNPFVTSRVLI